MAQAEAETKFDQIAIATHGTGQVVLYGLDKAGRVFKFDESQQGWRPMTMKILSR